MSAPQVKLTFPGGAVEESSFSGGLFINNQFVPSISGKTFSVINPVTEQEIAQVSEAGANDVDIAVDAARKAYNTVWGLNIAGKERGNLLNKFANRIEECAEELAAIEALDNGKAAMFARMADLTNTIETFRYYAGWADKNHGKTIEVGPHKFVYTRHQPVGVCGQIIPWNFPLMIFSWKVAPALATGNTVVLKTSELTPLSALRLAQIAAEIFPPGVLNILSGFGPVAGAAIANHMKIDKVSFTGSTLTGRSILRASAASNLKKVTLELGGKSPSIVFDDADIDTAVRWTSFGLFFNHGQTCAAGSRIYVHESIYSEFMEKFEAQVAKIKLGDPFEQTTFQGPQISKIQFDKIMAYIKEGEKEGAKKIVGGNRWGEQGYYIEPTIFTEVQPHHKIMQEEIFGPVVAIAKFKDEAEVIEKANDSFYGLASAVFSKNISRAIDVANKLEAGTVWVNQYSMLEVQAPFGGFKQSGFGSDLGEYALSNYTAVKSVHINLSAPPLF